MQRYGSLILAAIAFVGWIGYLGYLAATSHRPVVLSRPQILVAGLVVVAEVQEKDGKADTQVKVTQVRRGDPEHQKLVGETIVVQNLPSCQGWRGPGPYILPLERFARTQEFEVISLSMRSPGFDPSNKPMIYPANARTLKQLEGIPIPKLPDPDRDVEP